MIEGTFQLPVECSHMKAVIVGGVAAGASAAARLRRLDEKAEIVLFEKGPHVSFANCGLPYYIGNVIKEKSDLLLVTPAMFKERFNIDVRILHEVVDVDPKGQTVTVKDLRSGKESVESYDYLLLATGAEPIVPPLGGIDLPSIHYLRNVEDASSIKEIAAGAKKIAVVGGGFIGLEAAENLIRLGKEVHVYQLLDRVLPTYDPEFAPFIHAELARHGIRLHLGTEVKGFEEKGKRTALLSSEGEEEFDFVIMAIGVRPASSLAKKAGLALGKRGHIIVDKHMRTSDPHVFAAGDNAAVDSLITGENSGIALAGPANKEGRIAADNMAGIASSYKGFLGSSVIKLFSLTASMVGMGEKEAERRGIKVRSAFASLSSHASYYPGSTPLLIKLVFEEGSSRILGAEAIGYEGVDKRIDVIATAMAAGMKASDLKDLDLAYAPPYSSAKDPVNMLGFIAENIERGLLKTFSYEEVDKLPRDGSVTLLDVRTKEEYAEGHIDGFVNIPLDELRERIDEIDPNKKAYVHCLSGLRSYLAARILMGHGTDAYSLSGGWMIYSLFR